MKLALLPVTPYQQNCSLVVCTSTNRAALIDPGGEVDRLLAAVAKTGATLEKVLVTHGHVDHCGGAAEVAERANVPIEGPHREDAFWIDGLDRQGASFGGKNGATVTVPISCAGIAPAASFSCHKRKIAAKVREARWISLLMPFCRICWQAAWDGRGGGWRLWFWAESLPIWMFFSPGPEASCRPIC